VLQEHTGGESGKAPGSLLRRGELHGECVSEDAENEQEEKGGSPSCR